MTDPRFHLFEVARAISLRAPGPLLPADVMAITHELDILGAASDAQSKSETGRGLGRDIAQTASTGIPERRGWPIERPS